MAVGMRGVRMLVGDNGVGSGSAVESLVRMWRGMGVPRVSVESATISPPRPWGNSLGFRKPALRLVDTPIRNPLVV